MERKKLVMFKCDVNGEDLEFIVNTGIKVHNFSVETNCSRAFVYGWMGSKKAGEEMLLVRPYVVLMPLRVLLFSDQCLSCDCAVFTLYDDYDSLVIDGGCLAVQVVCRKQFSVQHDNVAVGVDVCVDLEAVRIVVVDTVNAQGGEHDVIHQIAYWQ